MAIDVGNGTTITFGTSSFAGLITALNGWTRTRGSVPTSNMATTSDMTFIPEDLQDPGEMNVDIQFDPTQHLPIDLVAETITVDWAGSAKTWAASGFATEVTAAAELDGLMTGSYTIKFSGAITEVLI